MVSGAKVDGGYQSDVGIVISTNRNAFALRRA